jgi:hypothetical protein
MRNNYNYILSAFVLIFFISSSSLFSQTYVNTLQNETWNSNADINTVFFKSKSSDLTITPNLKMLQFKEGNNLYGYSSDGSANDIPSGWTYEILIDPSSYVPANTTVSDNKKSITYSGDSYETLVIRLKVIDSSGNTIDNLGNVQLRLYIRGNLVVTESRWIACEQSHKIVINEISLNGDFLCRDYRLVLYSEESESSTVIYDSDQDDTHNKNSNVFKLSGLSNGTYYAVITDSCGQRAQGDNGFWAITIGDSYTFGADILFAGFQCYDDSLGKAVINIQGAANEITWTLKNSSGTTLVANSNDNLYTASSNYDPLNADFTPQNFTITIPNLSEGSYTFSFVDGNLCESEKEFTVKKPEEIEKIFLADESKTALSCFGDSDGKLTFVGKGGWTEPWTGNTLNPNGWGIPYTFKLTKNGAEISSGTVSNYFEGSTQTGYKTSFSGLGAGSYQLTITENLATNPYDETIYKCAKAFTDTFVITEPDELVATGVISNNNGFGISCNGADDGSINLK